MLVDKDTAVEDKWCNCIGNYHTWKFSVAAKRINSSSGNIGEIDKSPLSIFNKSISINCKRTC